MRNLFALCFLLAACVDDMSRVTPRYCDYVYDERTALCFFSSDSHFTYVPCTSMVMGLIEDCRKFGPIRSARR